MMLSAYSYAIEHAGMSLQAIGLHAAQELGFFVPEFHLFTDCYRLFSCSGLEHPPPA